MVSASAVRLSLMTDLSVRAGAEVSVAFRRLAGQALANAGRRRRDVRACDNFVPPMRQLLTGRYRLTTDCVHLLDAEDRCQCHVNVSWKKFSTVQLSASSDWEAGVLHRASKGPLISA